MFKRFRYRRVDEAARRKYRENFLFKKNLILPVFLVEGRGIKEEISSMPGVFHYSLDALLRSLEYPVSLGLESVLLFGVPSQKGIARAYDAEGVVQLGVRGLKKKFPSLEVITDVCLCSYNPDGQCHTGDNDETCAILARVALSHAAAGADIVAPSDMMDGRVFFIRKTLDQAGLATPVLSYAAKYASYYYGPFRDAADCAPRSGDRKSYQMDPPNGNEAIEEIGADIEEGSEGIIVKPALSYLDIIFRAKDQFQKEVVAYNVSGEYTMLLEMVSSGRAKEEIIYESLISMRRAGADRIITYFADDLLTKWSHWLED